MQVGHLKFFLLDPKSLVYFIVVFLGLEENLNYFISIAPSTLGEGLPSEDQLAMNDFHKLVLLSDCQCLMLRLANE